MDADSFFASCEISRNPKYKNKPVVVGGSDRGIAVAISIEAKKRGLFRGMTMRDMRSVCPDVIALPVDLRLYGLYSDSMMNIVQKYVGKIERYSIDECFAEIKVTCLEEAENIAKVIKEEIKQKLAITVSIGISTTKVLAKIASKRNKPDGIFVLPPKGSVAETVFSDTSVGKVWGIGGKTALFLSSKGITTIKQFVSLDPLFVSSNFSKPLREIWSELSGISVMCVDEENVKQKSIQKTRTFKPSSSDLSVIKTELSQNIERAFAKARGVGVSPRVMHIMLKTSEFKYFRETINFSKDLINEAVAHKEGAEACERLWQKGLLYRATGVTLSDLHPIGLQVDLFSDNAQNSRLISMMNVIDHVSAKYGKKLVKFGTSVIKNRQYFYANQREVDIKRLGLPFLGEVV